MGEQSYGEEDPMPGPETDQGTNQADATPPIGDESVEGQTQTPAADDDVGVPPDEEMNQET
ncbi:MAG: hypothetical protein AVDCRST_MAG53-2815 [uncultured Solirubrobacteraceae bacterium]|uniref:Uncharacterized protein n=1 Tax=uncultured Solirubrobacteraceae bacterium TaxID=1162706 RepID=A0A6J4SZ60_9ACTN|nr:MAG: hypothetical protein AVDCRST_MAG53-2815 [uncultured Solirubrobacteraceae bacterium]